MLNVFSDAFEAGKDISGDEKDAIFQGQHEDKARITFKKSGDGFLIDSICEDRYTLSFYPQNMPPPMKWVNKGYSATNSRILFMLDTLKGQNRRYGMDNLFISTKLLRGSFVDCARKTLIHGVCVEHMVMECQTV